MEKLYALEKTLQAWEEIVKTKSRIKPHWCKKYLYYCPVCEYILQQGVAVGSEKGSPCISICLLKDVWANEEGGCMGKNSPYLKWVSTDSRTPHAAAKQIVAGIKKVINSLNCSKETTYDIHNS